MQKKLITTKDYNIFLGRLYFTSNDESQNTFVFQPSLNTLEFKIGKVLILLLVGNQRGYIILNLIHYILLSWIVQNFLNKEWHKHLIKIP